MKTTRNVLIVVGVLAIILFVYLMWIGIKVASTVFVYILGALAIVFAIGWILYQIGKSRNKKSSD